MNLNWRSKKRYQKTNNMPQLTSNEIIAGNGRVLKTYMFFGMVKFV